MKPYNKAETTKDEEIREMFDTIAPSYDRLNHILSMQIDKIWRRRVVNIVARACRNGNCSSNGGDSYTPTILDVATGTGDLAIAMAQRLPQARVLGVDPSKGMLDVAQKKIEERGLSGRVTIEVHSAENLALEDERYDVVTAAFGVRNFGDLERGLSEMVRVTKCGGRVVVLEFSTPPNPIFRAVYNLYSRHLLPWIGALISRDRRAYEYLPASVEEFASRKEFLEIMGRVGLENCTARSQSLGIAQIYVGEKK